MTKIPLLCSFCGYVREYEEIKREVEELHKLIDMLKADPVIRKRKFMANAISSAKKEKGDQE